MKKKEKEKSNIWMLHMNQSHRERKRAGEKQREWQRERQNVLADPMSSGELVKEMTEFPRIQNVKFYKIWKAIF